MSEGLMDANELRQALESAGSPQRVLEIMKDYFDKAPKLTGKLTEDEKNKDESNPDIPELAKKDLDDELRQFKAQFRPTHNQPERITPCSQFP